MTYAHLGLREWPFRIVPEPEFCDFIADRAGLRGEVEELLSALENRPTSDIQLIWSWYGAGKTHTLYYLANECGKRHTYLTPVYTELPREAKGFPDLYRASVSQIPIQNIIDSFLEFSTRPSARLAFTRAIDPDLNSGLTQVILGERPVQYIFAQWLMGNSLPLSSQRILGVGGRVNTTEKCAAVWAEVIGLLTPRNSRVEDGTGTKRILWIIDEIQRVEELTPAVRRSVLSGIVAVFNRCPTGLTIVLSYTGTPREKTLPEWLPADLKDRIGLERPMLLPPLRSDEAKALVRDLLAHFRLPGTSSPGAFHPFEETAIEALVKALGRKGDLKPRAIMETLDACLRHCDPALRSGALRTIDVASMKEGLKRFPLEWSAVKAKGKGVAAE